MKTSSKGLALIRLFEGLVLKAYPDPGSGGDPWTIGYGHTVGVTPGMVCTQAQADAWLSWDAANCARAIEKLVKVPLTQAQFDALVSLIFNIGEGAFARSTLLRRLNAGAYADVPAQFKRWDKAGGKVMKGLVRRRAAEAAVWSSSSPVIVHTPAPTRKGWLWALFQKWFG